MLMGTAKEHEEVQLKVCGDLIKNKGSMNVGIEVLGKGREILMFEGIFAEVTGCMDDTVKSTEAVGDFTDERCHSFKVREVSSDVGDPATNPGKVLEYRTTITFGSTSGEDDTRLILTGEVVGEFATDMATTACDEIGSTPTEWSLATAV